MPVYLCQSGAGHTEPWRHGIQVYAAPFPIKATASPAGGGGRDSVVLQVPATTTDAQWQSTPQQQREGEGDPKVSTSVSDPSHNDGQGSAEQRLAGMPIRRVRHAEIVLVDDVCIAFGRYWLRLRWPGQRGGFAGYIAMGQVGVDENSKPKGTLMACMETIIGLLR